MTIESGLDRRDLLAFIAKAHRHTYAAPKEIRAKHKCETPILVGHKDYRFEEGPWVYRDSYAGRTWAPGREVVFLDSKPVWCMSYQGRHNEEYNEEFFQNKVFPFLKLALMNSEDSRPFRGPEKFVKDDFEYKFVMNGDDSYFTGRESITHNGIEVFFQDVMGELIK